MQHIALKKSKINDPRKNGTAYLAIDPKYKERKSSQLENEKIISTVFACYKNMDGARFSNKDIKINSSSSSRQQYYFTK